MKSFLSFKVCSRDKVGRYNNNNLRNAGNIPAVIYNSKLSKSVYLNEQCFFKMYKKMADGFNIFDCNLGCDKINVIVKSIQHHSFKPSVLHVDFQAVEMTDIVKINILINFVGARLSPGILSGGFLIKHMVSVLVEVVVSDIPRYLDIDISKMRVNDVLFLKNILLPKGVSLPILRKEGCLNLPVASIAGSRVVLNDSDADSNEKK